MYTACAHLINECGPQVGEAKRGEEVVCVCLGSCFLNLDILASGVELVVG